MHLLTTLKPFGYTCGQVTALTLVMDLDINKKIPAFAGLTEGLENLFLKGLHPTRIAYGIARVAVKHHGAL